MGSSEGPHSEQHMHIFRCVEGSTWQLLQCCQRFNKLERILFGDPHRVLMLATSLHEGAVPPEHGENSDA